MMGVFDPILRWPFGRATMEQMGYQDDIGTNHCEPINFGRELAKIGASKRKVDKRARHIEFHDALRERLGMTKWEWTD